MERAGRMNQQIHERIFKGVHTHDEKQAYTVLPIHETKGFSAVLNVHGNELPLPIDLHLSRKRQPSPTLRDYVFYTLRTTHDLARQRLRAYQEAEIRVHDQQRLGAPY